MKTRTDRHIDRFCHYLDQLIEIWDREDSGGKDAARIASKAYFFALVLGIDRKGSVLGGSIDWERIAESKAGELTAWEAADNAEGKEFLSRKERMVLLRVSARVMGCNPEVEYGTRNINFSRTDVEKFVKNLDKLHNMVGGKGLASEVKEIGKRLNKYAVSFGFVSKNRRFALQAGLVKEDHRQPYCESDWDGSCGGGAERDKLSAKIGRWNQEAEKLLDKFRRIEEEYDGYDEYEE